MRSVTAVAWRSPLSRLAQYDLASHQVIALACAVMGIVTAASITLSDGLGVFFGLSFVLVSVTAALSADIRALYTPGVLPPLLLIGLLILVAQLAPDAIEAPGLAESASATQRVIAGVVDHATALVIGHILALCAIAYRIANAGDGSDPG